MFLARHDTVSISHQGCTRRSFLRSVSAATLASGLLSLPERLSLQAGELQRQGRAMILLWMQGGPSQLETFDPKPGHENGGETEAIDTAVPGIRIAAPWEQTARAMQHIALIRSLTNKEGNHQRAVYQLHTGYVPSGGIKHPSFAACAAQQLRDESLEIPSVVSVGTTQGAGFLGIDYEPFVVQQPGELPRNVATPVGEDRLARRLDLFQRLEGEFAARGGGQVVENQRRLYSKAAGIVLSEQTTAFDIAQEPAALKERYGTTNFGKGCLLARRLVQAGVSFVEVRMDGWDTHDDNFARTSALAGEVDPAFATLLADLQDHGLLDTTTVLLAGEFGRTPRINARGGRDHFPRASSVALAGGGIRGGQVIGATTADGSAIANRPVSVHDLLQSVCRSLGIDPSHENIGPLGRPLKVVEGGAAIPELFA